MPFEVFRRHQRKMLAIVAILAMFGFVLSDGLFRMVSPRGGGGPDEEVARLYGRPVYRSDLNGLKAERMRANLFIARVLQELNPGMPPLPNAFGDISVPALVDAYILKHEADALGMPASPSIAKEWLRSATAERFTAVMGERIIARDFKAQLISGEQVLTDIAEQLRLRNVQRLPGPGEVTPLDVFRSYRDQNEKVVVHALAVRVDEFAPQVPDPSDSELQAFYEKYKNATPDPARPTPGFTTPRRVRLEFVTLDGAALEKPFRDKLTEKELRDAFEERKTELGRPNPFDELPLDVFADDPEAKLTPRTFHDVRSTLENDVVEAKVQDELKRKFDQLRDVMGEYSNAYQEAIHPGSDDKETRKAAPTPTLPPRDIKGLAGKLGLTYELTPLLTREELSHYGEISRSRVGQALGSRGGRSIAAEFFDPKTEPFTSFDLTDGLGRFYLAWKVEDVPPSTPPLKDIRTEVAAAWKRERARPLARKAAEQLAEEARKHDGNLKAVAGGRPVIVTEPISKLVATPVPGQYPLDPRPSDLPQFPNASEALRNRIFSLGDKDLAVEADQPESTEYVLKIARRQRVTFQDLYAPFGERSALEARVFQEATARRLDSWMADLRTRAGLKPDWTPPAEAERRGARPTEESDEG